MTDIRRQNWVVRSGVPVRLRHLDFNDFPDNEEIDVVRDWVGKVLLKKVIGAADSALCGTGLLLIGDAGPDKTRLAAAALNEILDAVDTHGIGTFIRPTTHSYRPAYFTRCADFVQMRKRTWDDSGDGATARQIVDGAEGVGDEAFFISVLILDDMNPDRSTPWSDGYLDNVMRARYDRALPTIVTTSVPLAAWDDAFGASLASFAREALLPVEIMSSESQRRPRR